GGGGLPPAGRGSAGPKKRPPSRERGRGRGRPCRGGGARWRTRRRGGRRGATAAARCGAKRWGVITRTATGCRSSACASGPWWRKTGRRRPGISRSGAVSGTSPRCWRSASPHPRSSVTTSSTRCPTTGATTGISATPARYSAMSPGTARTPSPAEEGVVDMSDRKGRCGALKLLTAAVSSLALPRWASAAEEKVGKKTLVHKTVGKDELKADVYRAPGDGARPVVVWIHGGALIAGDREAENPPGIREALCRAGYVVVSIDYRLAPETKLPAI